MHLEGPTLDSAQAVDPSTSQHGKDQFADVALDGQPRADDPHDGGSCADLGGSVGPDAPAQTDEHEIDDQPTSDSETVPDVAPCDNDALHPPTPATTSTTRLAESPVTPSGAVLGQIFYDGLEVTIARLLPREAVIAFTTTSTSTATLKIAMRTAVFVQTCLQRSLRLILEEWERQAMGCPGLVPSSESGLSNHDSDSSWDSDEYEMWFGIRTTTVPVPSAGFWNALGRPAGTGSTASSTDPID